jgi:hypothetical protein
VSVRDEPADRSDARGGDTTTAKRGKKKEDSEKVIIPAPQEWAEEQLEPTR